MTMPDEMLVPMPSNRSLDGDVRVPVLARLGVGPRTRPRTVRGGIDAGRSTRLFRVTGVVTLVLGIVGTVACGDLAGLAGKQPLPAGIPDPTRYHTVAGARALYQTTVAAFQYANGDPTASIGGTSTQSNTTGAFVDYVLTAGLFTDELQAGDFGCVGSTVSSGCLTSLNMLDARQLPEGTDDAADPLYQELQGVRNDAALAIGALTAYAPDSLALRGHLYALRGYAELLLADLFCSGVPLSTLNFDGTTSYTYASGSSTQAIYLAAAAQFDTAIALAGDSVRIQELARIGLGRAMLAIGAYAAAADDVQAVPDTFVYQFLVNWGQSSGIGGTLFTPGTVTVASYTMVDQKGTVGEPYLTNSDLRTAAQQAGTNGFGVPQYVPVKYGGGAAVVLPIRVADGIEARLIRAEAALQVGDGPGLLTQLNAARALAAPGMPALPADSLPSTMSGQVTLLFRERAYDLYLTGHRQGDLRRLIRQYHPSGSVYPTGDYPNPIGTLQSYGSFVTVPIPTAEAVNPHYHGCQGRGA